jgi:hypothetical protein
LAQCQRKGFAKQADTQTPFWLISTIHSTKTKKKMTISTHTTPKERSGGDANVMCRDV